MPYRQIGSFKPGTGVGGAGTHWSGCHFRALPEDFKFRTNVEHRYGKRFIPPEMTIQDFPVTYEDLEPHFDHFEYVCGTSGKAGVLNGALQEGGNPFEGSRRRDYPLPPNRNYLGAELFYKAAREIGYHPYPIPASNASAPYVNPYGCQMGPCNFCGFCSDYGCLNYSKASPNISILPVLRMRKEFELRANAQVLRVNLDDTRQRATGVTYLDAQGREMEQPADLVVLCAFSLYNVHLMLLSGIGKPYDPVANVGTVGRNYSYQNLNRVTMFFDEDVQANGFIGIGGVGTTLDDLNGNQLDNAKAGFIGGGIIWARQPGAGPVRGIAVPPGTPAWGSRLEKGDQSVIPTLLLLRGAGRMHVVPESLPRSRPDLQGCLWPAVVAHDIRLARQRDQGLPVSGQQGARHVQDAEAQSVGRRRQKSRLALQRHAIPEHAHLRWRNHGRQSAHLRA